MADRDQYIENLDRIFSRIGRRLRHAVAEDTLTLGQYSLLKVLFDHQPMTVGDIAEELGVSLAGASAMIDRLVHANLVSRTRSESDRRVVTVSLTHAGQQQIASHYAQRKDFLRHLFMHMSEEDLKTLLSLIERMEEGANSGEGRELR
ncbi:MAG: MarR family transcriptional regulator [Sulfobacillus thermotolerans]|uniref:HTH marR-type domain-containing protein n=1 Tax=Sulfobacillus thermotolerans TaxID=338644 RepID=A0ABM6RNP3_9FIRM|nr:hypothetical protein BXT84_02590 [Sulfobacillus thermotolerans]MCY0907103.1 MarR family transcriptional regulator [Sulfobacillus thermotolerans]